MSDDSKNVQISNQFLLWTDRAARLSMLTLILAFFYWSYVLMTVGIVGCNCCH